MERTLHTLRRGDGAEAMLRTEAWQHDPYAVYMPVSPVGAARLAQFQAASGAVQREDGNEYPTASEPLRWGRYGARVVLIVAPGGGCPHCQRTALSSPAPTGASTGGEEGGGDENG